MIIVGLGNPGKEYENTFHNMGFAVVDAIAVRMGVKIDRAECGGLTRKFSRNGKTIVLAKPLTYMNLSGTAVKGLVSKYKDDDILIIYDDIDIPRFSLRGRENGSAGTHNGMRHVIEVMKTENIKRVRVGIGRNEYELRDYVLSKIPAQDKVQFEETVNAAACAVERYIADGDFEKLMREINGAR